MTEQNNFDELLKVAEDALDNVNAARSDIAYLIRALVRHEESKMPEEKSKDE